MTSPTIGDVEAVVRTGAGLRTFLQPIVDLRFAQVAGYEALTRFDGSQSTPDRWFAVAQLSGLGAELEALALRTAFERRHELAATAFLAVNISPHLLGSAPVQAAFDAAAPLDNIVVELTEHVDRGLARQLLGALLSLRARGARIALDDMGTGYSGLREIATLQPDVVKLDRSFVDHCDTDPVKAAVVELMCGISNRLHATLIAEGVERVQELDWLQQAGVPLAQGWLLGRPDESPRPLATSTAARLRSGADLSAPPNRATAGAIMRWAPEVSPTDTPRPGDRRAASQTNRCRSCTWCWTQRTDREPSSCTALMARSATRSPSRCAPLQERRSPSWRDRFRPARCPIGMTRSCARAWMVSIWGFWR